MQRRTGEGTKPTINILNNPQLILNQILNQIFGPILSPILGPVLSPILGPVHGSSPCLYYAIKVIACEIAAAQTISDLFTEGRQHYLQ